jgi:hypothetical protein
MKDVMKVELDVQEFASRAVLVAARSRARTCSGREERDDLLH